MAKSLVTVTVENVFRNFLIDEERYELLEVVGQMEDVFFNTDVLAVPPIKNERIKAFLEGVVENFALGAASMLRVYASDERWRDIPAIVLDRARRAAASMCVYDADFDATESPRQQIQTWTWCLWANFDDALQEAHVSSAAKFGTLKVSAESGGKIRYS
jgi:hypothetical protein